MWRSSAYGSPADRHPTSAPSKKTSRGRGGVTWCPMLAAVPGDEFSAVPVQ
jgi:hypothetical protein